MPKPVYREYISTIFVQNDSTNNINDKSTEFYHLVPHVLKFGEKLPMLDSVEIVKQKIEIVDNLIEIETAYSILNEASEDVTQNPIDANYDKLKTSIEVIDPSSDQFQIIQSYVEQTHAKTHADYTLSINNIYTIDRQKEAKKYKD